MKTVCSRNVSGKTKCCLVVQQLIFDSTPFVKINFRYKKVKKYRKPSHSGCRKILQRTQRAKVIKNKKLNQNLNFCLSKYTLNKINR